jgi:predicted component of type VI protein secretion system
MKTTVELPDELYRKAKAAAALSGRKLKDLVEEGLRLVIETSAKSRRRRSLAKLMKRACGVVDSGVPDLASNPGHLKGLGRDAGHR